MRFDTSDLSKCLRSTGPKIGDVYKAKGGRGKAIAWVVVNITDDMCACLGIDDAGCVVGCGRYGTWCMQERELIGTVDGMESMSFEITRLGGC